MKLSISLDHESAQLLMALKDELKLPTSTICQNAIKEYADKHGFYLVPATVLRKET